MEGSEPRRPTARRRASDGIRFALERLLLRGLGYRLLLAAAIVVLVAIAGGVLVSLVDPGIGELDDAVWWAFLRLTDPGYLGDDEGIARRTISTAVTVLGYILFLGLLIAILTQWLNQTLTKLASGVTPVALSDHVLVLGWNHRTPEIVSELLRTGARVERFLERRGARELRIVILAQRVDDGLVQELRERLGVLWNDRQVLLRSGTPLRLEHLERVAFRDAAVLILAGGGFAEPNPSYLDAQTVKTLMSVSMNANGSGKTPPLAVAELYDGRTAAVARRAYQGDTEIVAADEIISRILAQSLWQRGLCGVFRELLTLDEGNALYVRRVEGQAGMAFGDLRARFDRAIALGTVRSGAPKPALNPDPETLVADDDLLVFVARSFEDCVPGETPAAGAPPSVEVAASQRPAREGCRLLVLGWSRRVPALLQELERYGSDAFEVDVVSSTPVEERERALEQRLGAPELRARQILASYTAPGVLERLEPCQYDEILLLASERLEREEQADASTVFAYQILRGLLRDAGARPALVVELLDEENRFLFPRDEADVIVSPLLVSYVLSQVALRRELAAVFAELSGPWGGQLLLLPAAEYLPASTPVRFEDLERAATSRGEIAVGLRRVGGRDAGLLLNPDRKAEWSLAPHDEVVILMSGAEPASEFA